MVQAPEFELVLAPIMASVKEVLQKLVFATERIVQVNTFCLVRCSIPTRPTHRDFNQMSCIGLGLCSFRQSIKGNFLIAVLDNFLDTALSGIIKTK